MIVAFASYQDPDCLSHVPKLALPNLSALLARLQAGPLSNPALSQDSPNLPHEVVWAEAIGLQRAGVDASQAGLPWAAAHSERPTEPHAWLTPCHFQVGMDHVRLIPPTDLALSTEHSQALCQALAVLCEEDGIALHWHSTDRWLAQGEGLRDLACMGLDRVCGRAVQAHNLSLGTGPNAQRFKRLNNEAQMLFYTQAAHDERVAQGLLPVNGFWLSAAGACASAPHLGRTPTMPPALRQAALRGDWAAWAQAWSELDSALAEPLARVRAGQSFSITLCGERHSQCWHTASSPASPWRQRWQQLWHTPPSVHAVLSAL